MITDPVRKTPNGSRAMTEQEVQSFLERICYGTLSYANNDGWPDSRVLNFVQYNGNFYFHAHKFKGEKLQNLPDGKQVCISFYEPSPAVGKMRYCQHESVLVYGKIYRMDDPENIDYVSDEQWNALSKLCHDAGTPFKAIPERMKQSIKGCSCFKIVPEYTVGKLTIFTTRREKSYLETLHLNET